MVLMPGYRLEEEPRPCTKYELPYVFYMRVQQPTDAGAKACGAAINEAFAWCRDQFGPIRGIETGDAWDSRIGLATGIGDLRWYGQRGLFLFKTPADATVFKVRWG